MSSPTNKRVTRKPQNRRASPTRRSTPAWLWFGSGLVVGIFLMLIKDVGRQDEAPVADSTSKPPAVEDSRQRPRFDFYDLLPESRVPVGADRPAPPPEPSPQIQPAPPAMVSTPAPAPKPTPAVAPAITQAEPALPPAAETPPTTTTPASERFLLQVGSFRSQGDADNLRAQLLLMGLSASIETFNPRQGETWHRVIVGPYSDHNNMDSARSQLANNGIDTLMLRR